MRSEEEVLRLKASRAGLWPLIHWIHRRRPLLTALLVLSATAATLLSGAEPLDLMTPQSSPLVSVVWGLMIFGAAVRLWGSGNLRKNQEITNSGIYVLVRHPLYLGSLSSMLAYFVAVGDPIVGGGLFILLVALVYYPTMLGEEEYLTFRFPGQFFDYDAPPRLLPDLRRLPEALRSDRFDVRSAYRNLGFRSLWFFPALPIFLRLLSWLQGTVR